MVAVDLGAAGTKAAWQDADGLIQLPFYDDRAEFPTAVYVDPEGHFTVANADSYLGSDRLLTRLKHLVHAPGPRAPADRRVAVGTNGDTVQLRDLLAAVIGHALDGLPEGRDTLCDRIVLTHPVIWEEPEQRLLSEALQLTGVETDPTFVTEPEAVAAYAVAHRRVSLKDGAVAVFDLGASTLDVAVVTSKAQTTRTAAHRGKATGGDDFDAELLNLVEARLEEEGEQQALQGLRRLRDERPATTALEARACKEQLSAASATTFATELATPTTSGAHDDRVASANPSITVAISRGEFIKQIEPKVKEALMTLEECIDSVAPTLKIATVLISGGSTQYRLCERSSHNSPSVVGPRWWRCPQTRAHRQPAGSPMRLSPARVNAWHRVHSAW